MNKMLIVFLLALALVVSACSQNSESMESTQTEDKNTQEKTATADVDNDGDNDVSATVKGNDAEIVVEMDDVKTVPTNVIEDFCVSGTKYTYAGSEGSSDSTIIGLTTYKGKSMCEAESRTEIDSPIGKIVAETTYYFDDTQSEFWVVTTTTTPGMASQTNEVHIVDGEVQ